MLKEPVLKRHTNNNLHTLTEDFKLVWNILYINV